jgi:antirestriction protein ArdC
MKHDTHQVITDRIIQLLEAGAVPWRQPWKTPGQAPLNLVSRKRYRGVNILILNSAGRASPHWLTFKQVGMLGGRVLRGEKSLPVVFWKILEEPGEGEVKKIPFLRHHGVFNTEQCRGLPPLPEPEARPPFSPLARCAEVLSGMPGPPSIIHGWRHAAYSPSLDQIQMPDPSAFESPESYHATLFHELAHATGHSSRLNRPEIAGPGAFEPGPYAREELVAEMGAAFLCGHSGIAPSTLGQSAAYIQGWLGQLRADRRLLARAAAQAQKACDHILNIQEAQPVPENRTAQEYKVVALRECPVPEALMKCDTPDKAAEYWGIHVARHPHFNPECECLVALLLNSQKRIKGHHLVSVGTLDTALVHAREVFRAAVTASAAAVILMHNHPSGEVHPSEADIRATRELAKAGRVLGIEVCDHIIMGCQRHLSLREAGYMSLQ